MESLSTGSFDTPPFIRGSGCWLYDESGKPWFDGTSGSGALSLGHSPTVVRVAVERQLGELIHTGCKLGSGVRAELVARLGEVAPFEEAAVLPTVVGTEAVEAALKIARAATGRRSLVAFRHAYHGKSSGSLAVTWRESFKTYSNLDHADIYRGDLPPPGAEPRVVEQSLDELERLLHAAASDGNPPAAVVLEPVQVTEGVLAPGRLFLEGLTDRARAAGALSIFDEIYTGFCRSGRLFYSQYLERLPDLLLVGKSLGNGFPISAVIGPRKVVNALPAGVQTSTYSGHPVSCAAALAVIDHMLEHRLWEEAARRGRLLFESLESMASEHAFVSSPRGVGMLLAFDCLDPAGRPMPALARAFLAAARERRLILFGGGAEGATVKIIPPVTMTDEDAGFLTTTLADVARETADSAEVRRALR